MSGHGKYGTYEIEGDRVFYRHWWYDKKHGGRIEVAGADAATFEQIAARFGRDRHSIYVLAQRVPEAGVANFRAIDGYEWHWGIDEHRAFCFYFSQTARWKVIATKSPASFRVLDDDPDCFYARDDRFVYFAGRRVRGADAQSFRNVPNDEIEKRGHSDFFVDVKRVYSYGRVIDGASPDGLFAFSYPGLRPSYAVDVITRRVYQPSTTTGVTIETLDEALAKPANADLVRYLAEHPGLLRSPSTGGQQ